MCTSIGFLYKEGVVFGRTLELGVELDNEILYVPSNTKDFIDAGLVKFDSKYNTIGSSFHNIASFGDGINEKGLMGSNNFLPGYASFSIGKAVGKINMTTAHAFDYLLTRCKDVAEVKERAEKIGIVEHGEDKTDRSIDSHFIFADKQGEMVVLEPKEGILSIYDNPYGVLTNSPEFPWHVSNLKNYLHLQAENRESKKFNGANISKLGEGTGMLGIPGDFTPPSRFVRAAYFVSNTPKDLPREEAIIQGFRILSQFDIPKGAIVDPIEEHRDETLYTSLMDTKNMTYFIKAHNNINIQRFNLEDYKSQDEIKFIKVKKTMEL